MSAQLIELDKEIIKLQDFNVNWDFINFSTVGHEYSIKDLFENEMKWLCNNNAFCFLKRLVSLKREKEKIWKTKGLVYNDSFGNGRDGYLSKEPINAYFNNALVKKKFDPKTNKIVLTIYLTSKDYKSMRSKDVTITFNDIRKRNT